MKILIDANGGDYSPKEAIKGAYEFSKETKHDLVLFGIKEEMNEASQKLYGKNVEDLAENILVNYVTQKIAVDETPTVSIKKKKDSAMVKALNALKNEEGDILISAGSTGALLTGAVLLVGRLPGVNRPALVPTFNFEGKKVFLADSGANTNIKEINLIQFAKMANLYAKIVEKVENPKIALLNIGVEPNKGTDIHKEAYKMLEKEKEKNELNFIGNIEARDVFKKDVNVIVTGGFEGNIFVKSIEGTLAFMKDKIKEKVDNLPKIFKFFIKPKISKMGGSINYKTWGGGVMLGIKRPVIKLHGDSDSTAFYYTLKQAERIIDSNYIEEFKKNLDFSEDSEKKSETTK